MRLSQFVKAALILFALCILVTCKPKYATKWASKTDLLEMRSADKLRGFACSDAAKYIPKEHYSKYYSDKTVRVYVHFMNSESKNENFTGQACLDYARDMINSMNYGLENNRKMNLPEGNQTPVLSPHYRLRLEENGVFEHVDQELYYFVKQGKQRNNYSRALTKKYEVRGDSILNIFIMPHHPDSIKSKTYRSDWVGIALGHSIKVAGLFENKGPASKYLGLLNHECGHVFGLSHSWGNDGCDDTPKHANCWNVTGEPPCEAPTSNNMMDYNAFQNAITPCQLGKMHRNFNRINSKTRKLVIPTWCDLDLDKSVAIKDSIVWDFEHDLEGNVTILDNAVLEIKCRTSMPANSKITIYPKGKLIINEGLIHNSCNRAWQGIEILSKRNVSGTVTITGNGRLENIQHSFSN